MSSQKSPQDLYPALFGVKAQKRATEAMKPQDMRLLQYCMRQASKVRPALTAGAAERPAMRRPGAPAPQKARFPGATR